MTKTQPSGFVRPRKPTRSEALPERFRELLEEIAGRSVRQQLLLPDEARHSQGTQDGLPHSDPGGVVIARYRLSDAPDRCIVGDLPAIAALGGARAMLSHGAVEGALAHDDLSDALVDNCLDVLRHLAALWDKPGREVSLVQTYGLVGDAEDAVPDEVTALLNAPARRLDVEITVAGYGSGRLTVLRS